MKAVLLVLLVAMATCIAATNTQCHYIDDENKIYYDLNPLSSEFEGDYIVDDSSNVIYEFILNPCAKLTTLVTNNICDSTTNICQVEKGTLNAVNLVANNITSLTPDPSGSVILKLEGGSYCSGNGNFREAIINVTCGRELGAPIFVQEVTCTYYFTWESSAGCKLDKAPGTETSGLSGGSILLIIFFVAVFLYLAIGMAYNFQAKNARGAEMIPNIEFWRDLPNLVKDGFAFTVLKIKSLGGGGGTHETIA